jgi:serine/threonine protein kinase
MLTLEETKLGHYHLLRRLCRGGMSEVYLAHDEQENLDVAIKVVNSYYVDHLERLQREAEAMRLLAHEQEVEGVEGLSILPILDYGQDGSWNYLVMPYMEHGTLRDRLARGRLSLEEAEVMLEQIASALQFAHDRGILHRDIKPSNILLSHDGKVYLADFGLAKGIDQREKDITETGCLIGTPEYMAPELVDEAFSTSCDIYALGVLLYQMVTGEVPFKGSTPLSVYWKHIEEQPVLPSQINPDIPHPVEEVILCALEKDPRRRFHTAQELALAYKSAIHDKQIKSVAVRVLPLTQRYAETGAIIKTPYRLPSFPRSNPRRAVAGALLLVFLLMSSLALGIVVSQSGAQVKASQLLGASAQSPLATKPQRQNPAPVLGLPTPTLGNSPTVPVLENINSSQPPQGHVQTGHKNTKQDKGHKHKHKAKSSQEDPTTSSGKCGSVPTAIEVACSKNASGVELDNPVTG